MFKYELIDIENNALSTFLYGAPEGLKWRPMSEQTIICASDPWAVPVH